MIHGGAGKSADPAAYEAGMRRALEAGEAILKTGGSALEAVVRAVTVLEDEPAFNAGRGSVLNEDGKVEMDASVMEGKEMNAGAVAGVHNVKNPVQLARAVMEKSEHVMLAGDGAMKFAQNIGTELMPDEYFITEYRIEQLAQAQKASKVVLDHGDVVAEKKIGTVGAVAKDVAGNLAAATSTGGIVNKKFGRVGDTPIIGAGTYADNATCAVSSTGYGEQFIRTSLAKTVSDFVQFKQLPAQEAAEAGISYLVEKVQGLGGVIVIDAEGNIGAAHSTPGLAYGYLGDDGPICRFSANA